jgi:hypothetical protein
MNYHEITLADWTSLGSKLFGPYSADWRFVCPSCQMEQGRADFRALGMADSMIDNLLAYSCVRRWTDQGCLHTEGGPVRLRVDVQCLRPTFEFIHENDHYPLPR